MKLVTTLGILTAIGVLPIATQIIKEDKPKVNVNDISFIQPSITEEEIIIEDSSSEEDTIEDKTIWFPLV